MQGIAKTVLNEKLKVLNSRILKKESLQTISLSVKDPCIVSKMGGINKCQSKQEKGNKNRSINQSD